VDVYYFKAQPPNFGDDLNAVLWDEVLPPDVKSLQTDEKICGIGTIINEMMPAGTYYILGTGFGYGERIPDNVSLEIFSVRGKLTAERLNCDPSKAITDGAIMIRKIWPDLINNSKKYIYSYLPHVGEHDLNGTILKRCCDLVGVHYISPCQEPHEVALQISRTEKLVTEAMHGAIFADNLRVRWTPVVTSSSINRFKWRDWCSSISIDYKPNVFLKPVRSLNPANPIRASIAAGLAVQIYFASRYARSFLSSDDTVKKLEERTASAIDEFISCIRTRHGLKATAESPSGTEV